MRLLAIETTGALGSFAVVEGAHAEGAKAVAEMDRDIVGRHVESGVGLVSEVLERASIATADLDGIAVSLGPGSFTGLRVGLGIAKGLCVGAGLPLAGVPTLDCLAQPLWQRPGLIVPVRDARRGEVYACIYRAGGESLEKLTGYVSLPPRDLAGEIRSAAQALSARKGAPLPITLVGDGLARYGEILRGATGAADFAPESLWNVRASVVGALGIDLLSAGAALDIGSAEPIYVRPSEAERKRSI